MGIPYQLSDGSIVFVTVADGYAAPTVEEVEASEMKRRAKLAARRPEDIAYGESVQKRRLAARVYLGAMADQMGWGSAYQSSIERGIHTVTTEERVKIEAFLLGQESVK